jgi:hypothetical protein
LIISKIDFLLEVISSGAWPRLEFAAIGFLAISLVIAISLGVWVGGKADNRPRSFILLSKAAEEQRKKFVERRRRDWYLFGVSVLTSILTGIISNIVFLFILGKLGNSRSCGCLRWAQSRTLSRTSAKRVESGYSLKPPE